jgi:hypothetical protein
MVSGILGQDSTVLDVQVLQTPKDEATMLSQKQWEPITQGCSTISQESRNLSYTAMQEPKYLKTSYHKRM